MGVGLLVRYNSMRRGYSKQVQRCDSGQWVAVWGMSATALVSGHRQRYDQVNDDQRRSTTIMTIYDETRMHQKIRTLSKAPVLLRLVSLEH